MGSPRKERCSNSNHDWQPMKRGSAREQCTICNDVFPCRNTCLHADCAIEREARFNEPLPDWLHRFDGPHDECKTLGEHYHIEYQVEMAGDPLQVVNVKAVEMAIEVVDRVEAELAPKVTQEPALEEPKVLTTIALADADLPLVEPDYSGMTTPQRVAARKAFWAAEEEWKAKHEG